MQRGNESAAFSHQRVESPLESKVDRRAHQLPLPDTGFWEWNEKHSRPAPLLLRARGRRPSPSPQIFYERLLCISSPKVNLRKAFTEHEEKKDRRVLLFDRSFPLYFGSRQTDIWAKCSTAISIPLLFCINFM